MPAGVIAAVPVSRPLLGRVDLLAGLDGAIAGLVSITAGPNITEPYWAIVIGGIGAVLCTAGLKLLERLKLDDVVGAVPAHLFAGIWGTLAVCIVGGGSLGVQLLGIAAIGAFVFSTSWLLWVSLEKTVGVRVTPAVEQLGQDVAELGMETYPEFVLLPEQEEERERAGSRPRTHRSRGRRGRRREGGEPRQEPRFGHRLDRDDPHPPGPAALAFRDAVDLGEDALHLLGTVTGLRHDGG